MFRHVCLTKAHRQLEVHFVDSFSAAEFDEIKDLAIILRQDNTVHTYQGIGPSFSKLLESTDVS